jgi:hypothetical protein
MWPFVKDTRVGRGSGMIGYYDEGMQAYKDGKELWQCPHVYGYSSVYALSPWMAGWMCAKQLDEMSKKDK